MPAPSGLLAGVITKAYYSATVLSTKSESTIETAIAVAGAEIGGVSDMGDVTKERDIIDVTVYGAEVASKVPGQADPGTFDMTISFDFGTTVHTTLRDDDGRSLHTFILEIEQTTNNKAYVAFDGYIANATVGFPAGDVMNMALSVARVGAATWVTNT